MTNKEQQFNEYFMIEHQFDINIELVEAESVPADLSALHNEMPQAFQMASEMAAIDNNALRAFRSIGDQASVLAEFLNQQSRKINLMMGYILAMQDDENQRYRCHKFGGGGLIIDSVQSMHIGQQLRMKLFLNEIAAAVYCYGEVIACDKQDDGFAVSAVYQLIREEDREAIVKASLHEQSRQLKRIKDQKNAQ